MDLKVMVKWLIGGGAILAVTVMFVNTFLYGALSGVFGRPEVFGAYAPKLTGYLVFFGLLVVAMQALVEGHKAANRGKL